MKKIIVILIACTFLMLAITSCFRFEDSSNSEFEYRGGNGDYIHHLFDNYEFMRASSISGAFLKRIDETNTLRIGDADYYYKYTHDGNRYIAMHAMKFSRQNNESKLQSRKINGTDCFVTEDNFQLYDTQTEKLSKYETYEEFQSSISGLNVNFKNWYYPSAGGSIQEKRIVSINDYSIMHISKYRGSKLVKSGFDVMQGEITKYAVVENEILIFDFKMNNAEYDNEFMSTTNSEVINSGHSAATKWIILNTDTGNFEEFQSEKDLYDALNLDDDNFQGMIDIS